MAGKVNLWNLGSLGVDLTKSPIHKEDGCLVSAQNAVPNIRDQAGGLTKRDGLEAVNSSALAGTVRGAIHVALHNRSTEGGTRTLYLAATGEQGWSYSIDFFATAGSSFGASSTNPYPTSGDGTYNLRVVPTLAAVTGGKLYYASPRVVPNPIPLIHVFDGTTDREFARIPDNPDATAASSSALSNFLAVGATIYLSVFDFGSDNTDIQGRVVQLDTRTGVLTRLGATFPTGKTPAHLAWSLGRLWTATTTDSVGGGDTTCKVYFIRPGIDADWTLDETLTSGENECGGMVDFKGTLYVTANLSTGFGTGTIWSRSPADGTWTAVEATDSYFSPVVFKDNLYVNRHTGAVSTIRKYTGTTWSTVLTVTTSGAVRLLVENNTLIAVVPSAGADFINVSSDGTTWSGDRELPINRAINAWGSLTV